MNPDRNVPETRIRPAGGLAFLDLREMWQHRELLYFLTWRDIKVRYKQTLLGAGWAIIQPVMMMVVFSIFFGEFAGIEDRLEHGVPYPLYYAGRIASLEPVRDGAHTGQQQSRQ